MKQFVNHVDHAVYLSRWETVAANVASLEILTDAKMERCEREDMGCVICVDWSAGLEIVAPMPQRNEINNALHERLESHGEGLLAIVYGVADLEAHKAKMEAKGFVIGPLMTGHSREPWYNRLLLRERFAPSVMNSWMVYSQIEYDDDLISFVDVRDRPG